MSGRKARPVFGVTPAPKVDPASDALEDFLDSWENEPLFPIDPVLPVSQPTSSEIRRTLTANATKARIAQRKKNEDRARTLRGQGLSAAQIAVRMTEERGDPQRPPIDARSVGRWLAGKET